MKIKASSHHPMVAFRCCTLRWFTVILALPCHYLLRPRRSAAAECVAYRPAVLTLECASGWPGCCGTACCPPSSAPMRAGPGEGDPWRWAAGAGTTLAQPLGQISLRKLWSEPKTGLFFLFGPQAKIVFSVE